MRPWIVPAAAIIGFTIVIEVLMALTDMGPHVVLVAAVCVLLGIGVWFVVALANEADGVTDMSVAVAPAPVVHTDRRVMRLRGLAYGQRNDASLEQLRTSLVEHLAGHAGHVRQCQAQPARVAREVCVRSVVMHGGLLVRCVR